MSSVLWAVICLILICYSLIFAAMISWAVLMIVEDLEQIR